MTTMDEVEKLLAKYVPLAKQITGKNITIERMKVLMGAVGNPQNKLNIIHIAGTSGKTSTAYYISQMLTVSGKKTGLTVSPHVDSVLERVQVNNKLLNEHEFTAELNEFVMNITNSDIEPTYFELLVAFAYWYFEKAGVDYAVIETGMGGLQDGTNIANNPSKLCVITDIGMDHMQILGDTIAQIAQQKAGIIHNHNDVLMYRQADEIMDIFIEHCNSVKANLKIADESTLAASDKLPLYFEELPEFQKRNWLLAYEVYKFIAERDNLPQLSSEKLTESMNLQIPGRMDKKRVDSKIIIMDGAHNEQKMQAFVSSVTHSYPDRKFPVLLSLKEGKEFATVLPVLKPIATKLIITTFNSSQDLPSAAIDPDELGKAASKFGISNVITENDQDKAYEKLIAEPDNIVIITGSFYLLGQLRNKHKELTYA